MTRLSVTKKGEWLTNHPKNSLGYWPRRAIRIREGQTPEQRREYAAKVLEGMTVPSDNGLIGIWLDQDLVAPPIFYPLCKDQKTYDMELERLKDPAALKVIEIAWLLFRTTELLVRDWNLQSEIERLLNYAGEGDLGLQEKLDGLAVGFPLDDEEIKDVSEFLIYARELSDESAPY
jgi:hypothetical protein